MPLWSLDAQHERALHKLVVEVVHVQRPEAPSGLVDVARADVLGEALLDGVLGLLQRGQVAVPPGAQDSLRAVVRVEVAVRQVDRLRSLLPDPEPREQALEVGVQETRGQDVVHGGAGDEHGEVVRGGGHVDGEVVDALQQPLEAPLQLLGVDVVRVERGQEHRRGLLLTIAPVHRHRHELLHEEVLVQGLIRLIQRSLRLPRVVRLEVLLDDGGDGVLVRDDDVRARPHPRLAELVVVELGAVVVRVVLVEREARVRLGVHHGQDLVLPLLHPVAGPLVVVLAGRSDRGGEALLTAVENLEGVRPHGLIEDGALLFREERHVGSPRLCLLGLLRTPDLKKNVGSTPVKICVHFGASVVSARCCWG